jgi:hypothetical protein
MTFEVEIVLRGLDLGATETVVHDGNDPAAWTDDDVRGVLRGILLAIDRVKNPGGMEPPITLRGFSWIVEPVEGQVIIALEIPMGAAVAGPFAIDQKRLDGMIARVLGEAAAGTVH